MRATEGIFAKQCQDVWILQRPLWLWLGEHLGEGEHGEAGRPVRRPPRMMTMSTWRWQGGNKRIRKMSKFLTWSTGWMELPITEIKNPGDRRANISFLLSLVCNSAEQLLTSNPASNLSSNLRRREVWVIIPISTSDHDILLLKTSDMQMTPPLWQKVKRN